MITSIPAKAVDFELGGSLILDFEVGADTIAVLEYSDGTDQEITGGNGVIFALSGGALFFGPQPHQLETLLNFGIKYSSMKPTENADLDFIRLPLELLAFYRNEKLYFRAGGGLALHLLNSLNGSGAASAIDYEFDPALGGIFQADFVWKGLAIGLRFTLISYTLSEYDSAVSANSLGVNLSYLYQF